MNFGKVLALQHQSIQNIYSNCRIIKKIKKKVLNTLSTVKSSNILDMYSGITAFSCYCIGRIVMGEWLAQILTHPFTSNIVVCQWHGILSRYFAMIEKGEGKRERKKKKDPYDAFMPSLFNAKWIKQCHSQILI